MTDDSALSHAALAAVWPEVERRLGKDELDAFESDVLLRLRAMDADATRHREAADDEMLGAGRSDDAAGRVVGAVPDGRPGARGDARQALVALFDPYPDLRRSIEAELDVLALLGERADTVAGVPDEVSPSRALAVPVHFATDRAWDAKASAFGGARGHGALAYGSAVLPIGDDRRLGELRKPRRWRLRLGPASAGTASGPVVHEVGRFVKQVAEEADADECQEALVFVHGYNVGFGDALRRAAQLAYDLQFSGACLLYSWPSEGRTRSYVADGEHVRWSERNFQEFLNLVLTRTEVDRVHVIAHSMGNRLLVDALTRLDTTVLPEESGRLGQVVFAAPDVDAGYFTQAAGQFAAKADRFTLYASSRDKALSAARRLAGGYPRAGQSGRGLVVVDGVDTVDASQLDTGLMSHSYFGDNDSLLTDLYTLIHDGHPPDRRFRLRQGRPRHPNGVHWSFDR